MLTKLLSRKHLKGNVLVFGIAKDVERLSLEEHGLSGTACDVHCTCVSALILLYQCFQNTLLQNTVI